MWLSRGWEGTDGFRMGLGVFVVIFGETLLGRARRWQHVRGVPAESSSSARRSG